MNCWHCGHELIWGGDHDTEDNEDYDIVSNLSCPKCHAAVDVWHPSEKLIKVFSNSLILSTKGLYFFICRSFDEPKNLEVKLLNIKCTPITQEF